mmetsp:Transcript_23532/g.31561  ORF Transcript_23532/g.31561 Transcript_23532/m.31561 type:complete len:127 (+) Transcript_23532:1725-2105(+)
MQLIADHANPFSLKELYLDGCEGINDEALFRLTKPREGGAYARPQVHDASMTELRQLAHSDVDFMKMCAEIGMGGVRSLEVLSLSECRQITDNGIKRLGKVCKLLRKVCFLGCGNLKDAGVIGLAR